MSIQTIRLKRPHQGQREILQQAKRFNVLKCGRRFGKTTLTENLSIEPALDKKIVGYWAPTYKDVSEVWEEIKFILHPIVAKKDEQLKQIRLITGGRIDFWSLEDPNNGRGFKYHRVIIDECEKARNFKPAWELAIRPTLTDYMGDAWFMSTPKFGLTFFKEIHKYKDRPGFENWNSWTKTSYDNPYLNKGELDQARAQYDDLYFRCEYLAEDVDLVGKPFAYAYSDDKHIQAFDYDPRYELHVSFDFNVDPMTAVVSQFIDDRIRIIKEYRLTNSGTREICARINSDFPGGLYLITGDATGRNRSAITGGTLNNYMVIQAELDLADGQMLQPSVNPSIKDSRVLLNSILQNFPPAIHPECKYLIDDLKYVEADDEGDIDKAADKRKSHLLDCFRYLLHTFHSELLNVKPVDNL